MPDNPSKQEINWTTEATERAIRLCEAIQNGTFDEEWERMFHTQAEPLEGPGE